MLVPHAGPWSRGEEGLTTRRPPLSRLAQAPSATGSHIHPEGAPVPRWCFVLICVNAKNGPQHV